MSTAPAPASPAARSAAGPRMRLAAVATALPGPPVGNEELGARLGLPSDWMDLFIGTRSRHFVTDLADGRVRQSLGDLCAEAARGALVRSGTDPRALDFVVLATATPDALMPTTAAVVADRLGAVGVPVYQIQSGCSGTVQALALAEALLAAASGPDGRPAAGLVLAGDVSAKHLDLAQDFRSLDRAALVNYVLFGDGAGAAVVTRGSGTGVGFARVGQRPVRPGLPPGQRLEWFGPADRDSPRPAVAEDYKAVERLVPELAEQACRELLAELDWSPESVGFLLPPQLGGRMTAGIAARLRRGLDLGGSKEVSCVAWTGNTGNALVLSQLEELLTVLGPGDRAVGVCVEASAWIAGGFALESDPDPASDPEE